MQLKKDSRFLNGRGPPQSFLEHNSTVVRKLPTAGGGGVFYCFEERKSEESPRIAQVMQYCQHSYFDSTNLQSLPLLLKAVPASCHRVGLSSRTCADLSHLVESPISNRYHSHHPLCWQWKAVLHCSKRTLWCWAFA